MKAIYGQKIGMTQVFTDKGLCIPVTVLELGPNVVHQVKTTETDGYNAIQVGYGSQKPQRVNRPMTRHLAKAKHGMPKKVREIRLDQPGRSEDATYEVGQVISLEGMFEIGQKVDVVGTSMGKGFAGVMKRHGMHGALTDSHGTHENFRHAGSIGCRKSPGRVFKNKRMAGHMGNTRVMAEGLEIVDIRGEDNALLVRGSVPGPKKGVVFVRESLKH